MHGVVDRVPADQSRKELPSRAVILPMPSAFLVSGED
jgi:hypothetical protein